MKLSKITLALVFFFQFHLQAQDFILVITGDIFNDERALGSAWGDYNNDGFDDLFNSDHQLFQNNGDGTFTKITEGDVLENGVGIGGTWGDYDHDGFLDLYTADPFTGGRLFHNNGDGTLSQLLEEPFTVDTMIDFQASSWVDIENDGDLDLFATAGGNNGYENNLLYENFGNGLFQNKVSSILTHDSSGTINCSWGDFNRDGFVDLFLANSSPGIDSIANRLYENNGDGTFNRILEGAIVEDLDLSLGSSWGDYDNDGFIDLFVANLESNRLYHNNGNGTFSSVNAGLMEPIPNLSIGSAWGDFDNDGFLDLVVTNAFSTTFLYINNGDGSFTNIPEPFNTHGGFGVSSADWDKDGDLDLLINWTDNSKNLQYVNSGNNNDWLNIHCVGVISNTSAIGAKVWVKATVNGVDFWQLREISGQTGVLGQSSLNAHFGLGEGGVIDTVRVQWPSGIVQVLTGISASQHIEIVEDTTITSTGEVYRKSPISKFEIYPNPAQDMTYVEFELEEQVHLGISIFNSVGKKVAEFESALVENGIHTKPLDVSTLPSGVYFCQLRVGTSFAFTKSFVVK